MFQDFTYQDRLGGVVVRQHSCRSACQFREIRSYMATRTSHINKQIKGLDGIVPPVDTDEVCSI